KAWWGCEVTNDVSLIPLHQPLPGGEILDPGDHDPIRIRYAEVIGRRVPGGISHERERFLGCPGGGGLPVRRKREVDASAAVDHVRAARDREAPSVIEIMPLGRPQRR